jgi:hypothetical protein
MQHPVVVCVMPSCAAVSLAAVDVRHARRVLELIVKVLAASHMWRPWFAHALDQQVAPFIHFADFADLSPAEPSSVLPHYCHSTATVELSVRYVWVWFLLPKTAVAADKPRFVRGGVAC